MQRKQQLLLALAAVVLLAAAAAPVALAKNDGGDDDSGKKSKARTAYSKGYLKKGAGIIGCKEAEVGDDDDATPVCSECKGPNFVYNDLTELCDCAPGYGTYATQHGTGKVCQICPKGWFGEGGDPETAECVKCPECSGTSGSKKGGATSVEDCNVYEAGYGWSGVGDDDDGAGNCAICEVGTWSDGGLRLGNGCYDCPRSHSGLKTTTADEGAVTPSACKIEVCKPGYAVNKLGSCKKCPEGYTSDGGAVEDGADQPLCKEDDDDAAVDDEGGAKGKGGKKSSYGSKDGGKGKKYAPEGDDDDVVPNLKKEAEAKKADVKKATEGLAAAAPAAPSRKLLVA